MPIAALIPVVAPAVISFVGGLFKSGPSEQAKAVAAQGKIPVALPALHEIKPDDTYYLVGFVLLVAFIMVLLIVLRK